MKIRYFVLEDGKLKRVAQNRMERVWFDDKPWSAQELGKQTRQFLSVMTDDDGNAPSCYFLRVDFVDGRVTDKSKRDVVNAMMSSNFLDDPQSLKKFNAQVAGLTDDWARQLAVAIDVPIEELDHLGIGGPLALALQTDMSVKEVLRRGGKTAHSVRIQKRKA